MVHIVEQDQKAVENFNRIRLKDVDLGHLWILRVERVLEVLFDSLSARVNDLVVLVDDIAVGIRRLHGSVISLTLGPVIGWLFRGDRGISDRIFFVLLSNRFSDVLLLSLLVVSLAGS